MDYTNKSSMEKYIKELMEMQKRSTLPQETPQPPVNEAPPSYKTPAVPDAPCCEDAVEEKAIPVFEAQQGLSFEQMDPVTDQSLYGEPQQSATPQQPLQQQDSLSFEEMDPVTDQSLYQSSCPFPRQHDNEQILKSIDDYLEEQHQKMKEASRLKGKDYEKATTDIFLSALNWDKTSPVFENRPYRTKPQDIVSDTRSKQQDVAIPPIPNPQVPYPSPAPMPNPVSPTPTPSPIPNPNLSNPAELTPEQEGTEPLYPLTPEDEQSQFAPQTTAPLDDMGYIYFFVTSGNQTSPVKDAVVTVSRRENGAEVFNKVVTTDISGVTPKIPLPAPNRKLTALPSDIIPYEVYNARISKSGYYDIVNIGMQVYGGQTAYVPVNMIPLPIGNNGKTDLEFITPENPLTNS
ncbi:MAG: hypothetical protein E7480_03415 [Ruminococcaceae bacterium]|nr:hypothetical protein [Oscillospiraceae bacterium]